jgi:hypothetical protein
MFYSSSNIFEHTKTMQRRLALSLFVFLSIPIAYYYYWEKKYEGVTMINSFNEYNFAKLTPHDLVVFDVDETLIQPTDAYLIHRNTARGKLFLWLFGLYNQDFNKKDYNEIRFKQGNRILIEPSIITIIQNLQANHIPVIGCTAMKSGIVKTLVIEQWRHEDLKSLGFQGSWSDQVMTFDSLPGKQIFYKGCIFTDLYQKGPALEAFLNAVSFVPKRIIFFDDCIDYLESVRTMCHSNSLAFEGYLYQGCKSKPWNTQLALYQLSYLTKHKIWLSDEHALTLISDQSVFESLKLDQ